MVYSSFTRSLQGFLRTFLDSHAPQGTSPGSLFSSRQSSYVTQAFPSIDIELFYQSPFYSIFLRELPNRSSCSSITHDKILFMVLTLWSLTLVFTPLSSSHFGSYTVYQLICTVSYTVCYFSLWFFYPCYFFQFLYHHHYSRGFTSMIIYLALVLIPRMIEFSIPNYPSIIPQQECLLSLPSK